MDDRTVNERDFIDRVKARGLADDAHAAHASRATLEALGEILSAPERAALVGALPPAMASELGEYRASASAEQLFEKVRAREGTTAGFAREHAEIVCRVLGDMLPDEVLLRLQHALMPSVAALFNPPPPIGEPPPHAAAHGERHHTLATGVPGSRHPISEAPSPGAEAESVVRATNPHEDRKLSSSSGLTQEQTAESLATEVPRTDRTIAESHD